MIIGGVFLCAQDKFSYSVKLNLSGTVERRLFYGAPNFVKDGISKKEPVYVLVLAKPIMVAGNSADMTDTVPNVSVIQIDADYKIYMKPLLKKTITAEGTLEQASTGHDHTDVVFMVTKIIK
jgi:hypothetical protein